MENIEIISMAGLVFALIIGIVVYFVFQKKKTQISDINTTKSNDNKSISRPLNGYNNVVNSAKTLAPNEIGSNICQETQRPEGDSDFQAIEKKNYKVNIFSSESEDDKDFKDFILRYDTFLLKDERSISEYFQYRSTKEFKRNIDRTPEKINLKKFVDEVFSQNADELTFFDRIFEEFRSGLDSGKIFPGIKKILIEYSDRNDNITTNICRKIRLNFSGGFETEELSHLINEKEIFFASMRMDETTKNLTNYILQTPHIEGKDNFFFEPFVDFLLEITDDTLKIIGFRDLFYILLMKPFEKIKYSTDLSDMASIKENFIFHFNRALFHCYIRLIKHLKFLDEMTEEKNPIFEDEFDFCGLFFHSNEETIQLGKNKKFPIMLNFIIKRYFVIICYMMFSCPYYKKIDHKNNSKPVFSWFNDQGVLFNSKESSKANMGDFRSDYYQVFFLIFKGVRLYYHIVNPGNTINNEYIRKLEDHIVEIAHVLDSNPITRKIFTAFFDLE